MWKWRIKWGGAVNFGERRLGSVQFGKGLFDLNSVRWIDEIPSWTELNRSEPKWNWGGTQKAVCTDYIYRISFLHTPVHWRSSRVLPFPQKRHDASGGLSFYHDNRAFVRAQWVVECVSGVFFLCVCKAGCQQKVFTSVRKIPVKFLSFLKIYREIHPVFQPK